MIESITYGVVSESFLNKSTPETFKIGVVSEVWKFSLTSPLVSGIITETGFNFITEDLSGNQVIMPE